MAIEDDVPLTRLARIQEHVDELRRAVASRLNSTLELPNLEQLDQGVCLAARGLVFRFVDVASWLATPDIDLAKVCCRELEKAVECLQARSISQGSTVLRFSCRKARAA